MVASDDGKQEENVEKNMLLVSLLNRMSNEWEEPERCFCFKIQS